MKTSTQLPFDSICDSVSSPSEGAERRAAHNALTVDVEDYFHVAALSSAIRREDWPRLPMRVEGSTRRLLDLFERHEVTATFFVLGWVAEKCPALVREIRGRGHEVACHGMSHRMIYEQSREEFRAETLRSKDLLEQVLGEAVRGYRAASYSITDQSLWALDILVDAGFRYDSSIVPVRHDLYGIPGAPRDPHVLLTHSGALREFPPSTVRLLGQDLPVGGGGYFRLYPYGLTKRFLRSINDDRKQPFIFYVHPWEIDVGQPRVKAGALSRFRHYHNLDKCESRLERLIQDFEFDTVANVLSGLEPLPEVRIGNSR